MSKNITVKNVLEWMSCDRDIQLFEGVTLKIYGEYYMLRKTYPH